MPASVATDPGSLKVLYLQGSVPDADRAILQQLAGAVPSMELAVSASPADVLTDLRGLFGWQAVVVSPRVAPGDMLALLDTLRRDGVPVAVAPVIDEAQRELRTLAVTHGADSILVTRDGTVLQAGETMARLAQSPNLPCEITYRKLKVLYLGTRDAIWTALEQLAFLTPTRLDDENIWQISKLSSVSHKKHIYDVVVIDDTQDAPHTSEVVTAIRSVAPEVPVVAVSTAPPTAPPLPGGGLIADITVDGAGPHQQQLVGTLRRLHENIEGTLREAETKAREERLREIVDRVPAGIVVIGADSSVLAMNAEALHLFGASSARQVVGRDFRSFLAAEDIPPMTALLHRLTSGDPETLSVHADTLDGRRVTLLLKAVRLGQAQHARQGIVASVSAVQAATTEVTPDATPWLRLDESRRRVAELEAALAQQEAAAVAERTAFELRMSEREAELWTRLEAERTTMAAERALWSAERSQLEQLRGPAAAHLELQRAFETLRLEHADLQAAHAAIRGQAHSAAGDRTRLEEAVAAEQLTQQVLRDEIETVRTLLQQEQKKRADAERRQSLLQDAYARASDDRERLLASTLFGYAVTTLQGEVVRCNDAFARLFGYIDGPEVLTVTAGRPFPMLAGRQALDARLAAEGRLTAVESTIDRLDGQPVRIVESAVVLSDMLNGAPLVERVFVPNGTTTTVELLRAQRLGDVGALAISMTPSLESIAATLRQAALVGDAQRQTNGSDAAPALTGELHALVRQLGAFGRRQTTPIEGLDLDEVIRQTQPTLARLIGDFIDFEVRLDARVQILASRPDVDQLLVALATATRDLLPLGGLIAWSLSQQRHSDDAGKSAATALLSITVMGHGAVPATEMPAVSLAARRCDAAMHVQATRNGGSQIDVVFKA